MFRKILHEKNVSQLHISQTTRDSTYSFVSFAENSYSGYFRKKCSEKKEFPKKLIKMVYSPISNTCNRFKMSTSTSSFWTLNHSPEAKEPPRWSHFHENVHNNLKRKIKERLKLREIHYDLLSSSPKWL